MYVFWKNPAPVKVKVFAFCFKVKQNPSKNSLFRFAPFLTVSVDITVDDWVNRWVHLWKHVVTAVWKYWSWFTNMQLLCAVAVAAGWPESDVGPGDMCWVPDFRAEEEDVGEERRKLLEQSEQLRGFDPLLLSLIRNICGDTATMRVHHSSWCQRCFQARPSIN